MHHRTPPDCRRGVDLIQRDRRLIARSAHSASLAIVSANGATITDQQGRRLTDLTSGWNVVNTGWQHPDVVASVQQQASRMTFAPSWCTHPGRVDLADALASEVGWEQPAMSLCGCGGSEAIETALKVARRATGRHGIVGFTQAYHGGTLGAMIAGGIAGLHGVDLPKDTWHRYAPIPDYQRASSTAVAAGVREAILSRPAPAAVLLEPIFTNPGVLGGDKLFYQTVQDAAQQAGALVIVDEIGTGFARTGRMFGFQTVGLKPDIIAMAKAMSSGVVPISATVLRRELASTVSGPGFDSTFGWTPLACAAGLATLSVIRKEGLVQRASQLGRWATQWLERALAGCPQVAQVRGYGLEIGIELVTADRRPLQRAEIKRLLERLLHAGVFLEASRYTTTLLIMPPLTIEQDQFKSALVKVVDEIKAQSCSRLGG